MKNCKQVGLKDRDHPALLAVQAIDNVQMDHLQNTCAIKRLVPYSSKVTLPIWQRKFLQCEIYLSAAFIPKQGTLPPPP